jgi:hypothetical protein
MRLEILNEPRFFRETFDFQILERRLIRARGKQRNTSQRQYRQQKKH